MENEKNILDQAIEESLKAFLKAAPGSKERITEGKNLKDLYKMKVDNDVELKKIELEKAKLEVERYRVETDAFLKERQVDNNEKFEQAKLDNDKKIDFRDIIKLGGFGALTILGMAIEKREGILLNPNFRNLPGKIKFW